MFSKSLEIRVIMYE